MKLLSFDPGMRRMGWAWLEREGDTITYLNSGVLHFPEMKPFQKQRLQYVKEAQAELAILFDLTQPDAVVNETVPAIGTFNGVQMYLANVAITVVQTVAFQRGLPVNQIGATSVHSKFFPGRKGKVTKPKLRNAVIELFPELESRRKEWTGKGAIYEEPDAIAIGAVELGHGK
jgi:Holliday junction resolvasome RuvABC endonuclease subunit